MALQIEARPYPLKTDGRIRSACSLCQNFCGLFAYVADGKVVKLEGDPDNPRSRGHLCAKGLSGFLNLYSPKRVTKPLIRTNPEKGIGIDPRWREASWEEALELVADRVKKARDHPGGRDPRRILFVTFDHWGFYKGVQTGWMIAAPSEFIVMGAACFCGNAVHPPSFLNTSTFEITVEAEYTKYVLLIGAQAGSIIHYDTMNVARHIAEKRPGQVKVVVVDPLCSHAGSRAEEWVPIRPGTDAAFILALANLLMNEYKIYDARFLKEKTNAVYLVGRDGRYVRDASSGKPLVWDARESKAKTFDAIVGDYALEGEYLVDGQACRPGFEVVREHIKKYTAEYASKITTIPEETIRRIAKELGEAASIGSTIMIDDEEIPHRPVSIVWYRGLSAHKHSFLAGLAAMLLPTLLGAIQVPGGIQGHPPAVETVSEDGLMEGAAITGGGFLPTNFGGPYPPHPIKAPKTLEAFELFPVSVYSMHLTIAAMMNPERFGFKPGEYVYPEIMFTYRDNSVKNTVAPELVAGAYKKIPFIVSFNVELDETANLADVVFPDLHHLERLAPNLYLRVGEPGYWYGPKPAVKPPFEAPFDNLVDNSQILLEIARRVGFLPDIYRTLNDMWNLKGTPCEFDSQKAYPYHELVDARLKSWLGRDRGIDWMYSDEGGLLVWKATPQERFKGAFRKSRVHFYYEFMLAAGQELEKVIRELDIAWDTADYQAVPDWKPCQSYVRRSHEYDMFVTNYKVPFQIHGVGRYNPVLGQLVSYHGLDSVLINSEVAKNKGIKDGDEITIETIQGRRSKGVARLTERVHREVIATMQHRLSKGADFNSLLTMDDDMVDFVGCAVDSCLLAKVDKA